MKRVISMLSGVSVMSLGRYIDNEYSQIVGEKRSRGDDSLDEAEQEENGVGSLSRGRHHRLVVPKAKEEDRIEEKRFLFSRNISSGGSSSGTKQLVGITSADVEICAGFLLTNMGPISLVENRFSMQMVVLVVTRQEFASESSREVASFR